MYLFSFCLDFFFLKTWHFCNGCPQSIFSRVRCSLCSPLIAELLSAASSRHLPPFWMIKCSYFPSQESCTATESITLKLCVLGCISGSNSYWSENLAKSLICSNPHFPHLKKRNKHPSFLQVLLSGFTEMMHFKCSP